MNTQTAFLKRLAFPAIVLVMVMIIPITDAEGGSPGNLSSLDIGRMGSLNELKRALNSMHACMDSVRESQQLSFEIQKTIAAQSGACISRLVDMSQNADLSQETEREEFKSVFLKNGDLLRRMLTYNQTRIDDMLEDKLEHIQDKDAFFASPEWEQPQYLITVASYWLGWNNYYAALLYQANEKARTNLLDEAVSGFTRTLPDLKEQSLANQCIFGRALCFKEQKKYDKALQDIQSLMAKLSREDSLYAQAGYERALISHLSGKSELAIKQIQTLQDEVKPGGMPPQLKAQLKNLQIIIALHVAEKKTSGQDANITRSYHEAVQELKHIAETDAAQAGVLYRYVFDHAGQLAGMPDTELGRIGSLAMADWHFDRKEYEMAIDRYKPLYSTPDLVITNYFDGVCFRLAYCYSQKQLWQNALACLETLVQKYPGSSFGGKAACLYHVVAARAYEEQSSENTYERYIRAADCYVKHCPDATDKSEAHFQLGRYYQQRGRMQDARIAFAKVGSDSTHYSDARQASLRICVHKLQSDVEALEALIHDGRGQSEKALKLHRESLKLAEDCQKTIATPSTRDGDTEPEAYLTLLLARLYLHASEPSPRKALQLLRRFEEGFSIKNQQESLHDTARKLRLECYLQLDMLRDAEGESAAIIGTTSVDKKTWAFLNECADRYYTLAHAGRSETANEGAAGHAAAALVVYTKLADSAGKDPAYRHLYDPLQMRLAELYTISRQLTQAAAIYQAKLQRDPTSADALYNLAVIYEREDRWENAFTTWNKLARGLQPGNSAWFEARYRTAWALIRLGKHKEACEVIAVTTSRYPDQQDEELKRNHLKLQSEYCRKKDTAHGGK